MTLETVQVKEEPEWEWDSDTGVSEAATLAGLYEKHEIKQELVLGPEVAQVPDMALALHSLKKTNEVLAQEQTSTDCVPPQTQPSTDWVPPQIQRAEWLLAQKQMSTDWVSPQRKRSTNWVPQQKEWSCKLFNHQNHYTCDYCHKQFIKKHSIRLHMLMHQKRYMPLICNVCNVRTKNYEEFTKHMSTHTENQRLSSSMSVFKGKKVNETVAKLFKCNVCGKGFKQKGNLAVHVRTHTGDKPYQCKLCAKEFRQQTTLNNHMLWHKGVKPHVCHLCPQRFTQVSNLRQHILNYHPDDSKYNSDSSKHNSDSSKHNSDSSKNNSDSSKYNSDSRKYNSDSSKYNSDNSEYNLDNSLLVRASRPSKSKKIIPDNQKHSTVKLIIKFQNSKLRRRNFGEAQQNTRMK